MELKDVILSTLAEMEEKIPEEPQQKSVDTVETEEIEEVQKEECQQEVVSTSSNNELYFLKSIRERLLVLFEGFQAPNNTNIEAKIDMTLNFLEYTLATIDERVEKLEKGNQQ
jgi:hypothetical protein